MIRYGTPPQGLILEPLLFDIFLIDLAQNIMRVSSLVKTLKKFDVAI